MRKEAVELFCKNLREKSFDVQVQRRARSAFELQ